LLKIIIFDEINVGTVLESEGSKSVNEGLFEDIKNGQLNLIWTQLHS